MFLYENTEMGHWLDLLILEAEMVSIALLLSYDCQIVISSS